MNKFRFFLILIQIYLILSNSHSISHEDELDEDEDIVYGIPTPKKSNPIDEVKNRMDSIKSNIINLGYDFSRAIKILYSNYTNIDLRVSDIDWLYKKNIINENQAILIWENLLNTKTERNLEWLGYNKINKNNENTNSNIIIQNFYSLFNSSEIKYNSYFTYIFGFIFLYIMKYFLKYPKLNITMIFFVVVINIFQTFYYYKIAYYFTSFISLISIISNIYYLYLSLIVLSGNKEIDYSIFHTKHFKSKEHFLIKSSICTLLIIIMNYLASVSLRYFLNYILIFIVLEKNREIIKNYFKHISPKNFQPFENFISIIFGIIVLLYTHIFYHINIYFSYDLNSFLIINNMIVFYYITSLERFIYIQRNNLGGLFLECEKVNDNRDKYEMFEELKKKNNTEKNYRNEAFDEGNIIDVLMIVICLFFLILGFYTNTYFYLILSLFILNTIHKNCLIFLSIKVSRITSNFLLLLFLIAISNIDQLNFSYINEIIAIYDPKFLEALLLLFKLLFLVSLAICNYLTEDFVDLFNIYNYSSYLYLYRETRMINNNQDLSRRLKYIYRVPKVLKEIFQFNLSNTLDAVNIILDSINNTGSNIVGFYIEHLLTNNTTNYFMIHMITDYLLMYANIWILFDCFRNNNHSFFFITSIFHKIGIFSKMFLLIFEYSKTKFQKYCIVILNMIFMMRLMTYPELDHTESVFIFMFFVANVYLYIILFENNVMMNFFIFFFNFIMLKIFPNSLLYVGISIGSTFAKNMIEFFDINHFKAIVYISCSINSLILFSSLDKEFISIIYTQIKILLSSIFKIDFLQLFEELCFIPNNQNSINSYFENILINRMKQAIKI